MEVPKVADCTLYTADGVTNEDMEITEESHFKSEQGNMLNQNKPDAESNDSEQIQVNYENISEEEDELRKETQFDESNITHVSDNDLNSALNNGNSIGHSLNEKFLPDEEKVNVQENNSFLPTKDSGKKSDLLRKSSSTLDDRKDHSNDVDRFYTDSKESITVHLLSDCGIRIEFYHVPKKYYSNELIVLVNRDTGLRHNAFQLLYEGEPIKPMKPLEDFADRDGIVRLNLKLRDMQTDAKSLHLGERLITFKSGLTIKVIGKKAFVGNEECSRVNLLKVNTMQNGEYEQKSVTIEWLPPNYHKPFLGGYRHKIMDKRFLHAYAQTKRLPRPAAQVQVFSRDAQTYKMKHFGQATVNHMSTQFPKPGFFVSNYQDKLLTPGIYETADEYLARILKQIIIIQKYTRRWLAKRYVNRLRKIRDAYLQWETEHDNALKKDRETRVNHDLERRLHPKCRSDFDRLFNALEQRKREEIARVNAQNLSPAERKAALALLLDEEAELIAAIGRHQLCASKQGNEAAQVNLLKKAAAPIRWLSAINGRPLEVETQQTLRAKELLDMHISLSMECLTQEERLDILLTVKRTVSEYQHKICKEIIGLIDREAELMMRGIRDEQLKGLRRRILNRFVKFCEMPDVNPEISNYLNVPTGDREKIVEALRGNVQYCVSCDRYLKASEFPLSARANRLAPCKSCRRQNNRARKRLDLTPYQHILMELRKNELDLVEKARKEAQENAKEAMIKRLERGETPNQETIVEIDGTDPNVLNTNPFPFLMNKEDIQFLIDDVWERRSVLSGWLDITDLVLTRWRLKEPWSPWNTILVTREEAEAHAKLGNFSLEAAYADALLNTVNQRLVMGQNAFRRLQKNGIRMAYEQVLMAKRLNQPENTIEWLRERRQRLPPLVPHQKLESDSEARHKPNYQPPEYQFPAIGGEKLWKDAQETV